MRLFCDSFTVVTETLDGSSGLPSEPRAVLPPRGTYSSVRRQSTLVLLVRLSSLLRPWRTGHEVRLLQVGYQCDAYLGA